jgi:hypothetical protein
MEMLWFWLVSVFSVSPVGIRETSEVGHSFTIMGVGHV